MRKREKSRKRVSNYLKNTTKKEKRQEREEIFLLIWKINPAVWRIPKIPKRKCDRLCDEFAKFRRCQQVHRGKKYQIIFAPLLVEWENVCLVLLLEFVQWWKDGKSRRKKCRKSRCFFFFQRLHLTTEWRICCNYPFIFWLLLKIREIWAYKNPRAILLKWS